MTADAQSMTPTGNSSKPWLAWILSGIVIMLALVDMILIVRNQPADSQPIEVVNEVVWKFVPIIFVIVGVIITSRQPHNRIGLLLMAPALQTVVSTFDTIYMSQFTGIPPPSIPVLLITWFESWSWMLQTFPLFFILLLYPSGQPLSTRWRWVIRYAVGMVCFFLVLVTFAETLAPADESWAFPNPIGFIQDNEALFGVIFVIWFASLGLLAILSGVSLFLRYRRGSVVERLQIKWLLFTAGIFLLCYVPLLPWKGLLPSFYLELTDILLALSIALFPVAIGFAILRYRLYDIDILINRTLVYAALTGLVIVLYDITVGYLGILLKAEDNAVTPFLATGLVAVIFQPLRNRLQLGVNRLMYGQRDEPVAVLSQLGARLEATLIPDQILPRLVETVAQALKLPYVGIALRVADDFKVRAENGKPSGVSEVFPLIYQGEVIGHLLVDPRARGEDFNSADRLLLTNIARQAGAVAHSVQLTVALQQSRQQLVTAREEERRRLRRDLHDGLGPQLASQTLTIDAVRKLMDGNPQKARELLDHLKTQSQTAIQDIRRLVYELRPPALDELGLVEALRQAFRQNGTMESNVEVMTDPSPLPPLPAAVEVAVYRISQEAITNVLRHAQAKRCMVTIFVQERQVDLVIADDGRGYPVDFHFGVGLNSMRERTEELGGTIRFENQARGGARVEVWLPLPGDEE